MTVVISDCVGSYGSGMTRGQLGRELARVELTVAAAIIVMVGFLFVTAPAGTSPMFGPPSSDLPYGVALLGLVVGFAWMIRIYRGNPEPDPDIWRYRERAARSRTVRTPTTER
jgi:hypothetical protein